MRYAYNEKGELVRPKDGEPIYAMKDGVPFLEIVSPSYEELAYSRKEGRFEYVPSWDKFYHLASDGSRDSEVEPYTGGICDGGENRQNIGVGGPDIEGSL